MQDELSQIIKGCSSGDRNCQSALYKLYAPAMMTVSLRYAKNRQEAEEILQNGFIQAFKFIAHFKYEGSLQGWLRKIIVNCALQKLRSQSNSRQLVSLYTECYNQPDSNDVFEQLTGKELLKIVQSLPPMYRKVFNLYVFEGMKHREIAEILNISEGTSRSNLSDARAILKKSIFKNLKVC